MITLRNIKSKFITYLKKNEMKVKNLKIRLGPFKYSITIFVIESNWSIEWVAGGEKSSLSNASEDTEESTQCPSPDLEWVTTQDFHSEKSHSERFKGNNRKVKSEDVNKNQTLLEKLVTCKRHSHKCKHRCKCKFKAEMAIAVFKSTCVRKHTKAGMNLAVVFMGWLEECQSFDNFGGI